MLIEDLMGRDEEVSSYCFKGLTYRFKRRVDGRKIGQVCSQEHIGLMLGSGNFREYKPDEEAAAREAKAAEPAEPKADEWAEWEKTWSRMGAKNFVGYTEDLGNAGKRFIEGFAYKNIDRFNSSPEPVLKRAIDKWNKQVAQLAESGMLDNPTRIWPGRTR